MTFLSVTHHVCTYVPLSEPHAVAVNATHFLVTEWGAGKLTFFDRDIEAGAGNASSFEEIDAFKLKNPTGIAVDRENFVYLADAGDWCVTQTAW